MIRLLLLIVVTAMLAAAVFYQNRPVNIETLYDYDSGVACYYVKNLGISCVKAPPPEKAGAPTHSARHNYL